MKYEWAPLTTVFAMIVGLGYILEPYMQWLFLGDSPREILKAQELERFIILTLSLCFLFGLSIGLLIDWYNNGNKKS